MPFDLKKLNKATQVAQGQSGIMHGFSPEALKSQKDPAQQRAIKLKQKSPTVI